MVARTHNVIAFAALVTTAAYFPPQSLNLLTLLGSLIGNVIGALTPDLDQASAKLWNLVPGGGMVGDILRPFFLGHRTLSHSLLGTYLYHKLLIWLLPKIINTNFVNVDLIIASMMIGFLSHLLADIITTDGLPLFFPIKLKIGFPPFESLRLRTGSWLENLVVFPAVLAYVIWFGINNRQILVSIINLVHN